jgi:hypothetical protein
MRFLTLALTVAMANFLPIAKADDGTAVPKDRIAARTFPSVFQAWNPADNLKGEDRWTTLARHDLVFHAPSYFGLRWEGKYTGLSTEFVTESVPAARKLRENLLRMNANLIMLAEIRYRDAPPSYLPADHPWWKRQEGQVIKGWEEGGYLQLDFANPEFQSQIAKQAKAAVATGVFDGVMLDWWNDDSDRIALVKAIRTAIGDRALILANANDRTTPKTAAFINGYFMECGRSSTGEDWKRIADTLQWAELNLKEPRINCVETWFHESRNDLNLMRATTTLTLTLSDGYCLFSDPNPLPTPDHLHNWYAFWNKSLGRPNGKGIRMSDGSFQRTFEGGLVVYNPMGNTPVTVVFNKPYTRISTDQKAMRFTLAACDGDLFLCGG